MSIARKFCGGDVGDGDPRFRAIRLIIIIIIQKDREQTFPRPIDERKMPNDDIQYLLNQNEASQKKEGEKKKKQQKALQ